MSGWLWSSSEQQNAKKEEQQRQQEAKERAAVDELKALLQTPEGKKAAEELVQGGELQDASEMTSDLYLRKWLFAREWDVPLTHTCILAHAGWRAHTMPHGYIDEAWIQDALKDEKVFLQGCDKQGRGFTIIRVSRHAPKADKQRNLKPDKLFVCYIMNAVMAVCNKEINPRQRLVSMFDMTGCSMANLDVPCMRMILGLLNQHYVETLSVMYFYNPPLVFWGIWNTFKGLIPPVTREKIKMIDPADLAQLQADFPPEVLPKEYGGAAELLLVNDAIRKLKLPPYPHLPELAGTAGVGAPADIDSLDESAALAVEQQMMTLSVKGTHSAAVEVQATSQTVQA
eukprot:gene3639-3900_t